MKIISKPCESCNEPVKDIDNPSYKDKWQCHFCHLIESGKLDPSNLDSVKSNINSMSLACKYLMNFDYS